MTHKEKVNNLYWLAGIYITVIGALIILRSGIFNRILERVSFFNIVNSLEYLLLVVFFVSLFSLRELKATRTTRSLYNIIISLEAITLALHSINFAMRMLYSFEIVSDAVMDLIYNNYFVRAIIEFSPIITLYIPTLFLASVLIVELNDINWMILGITISNIFWILFYKIIPESFLTYGPVIGRILRSYYFGYLLELLWVMGAILVVMEERSGLTSKQMRDNKKTAV